MTLDSCSSVCASLCTATPLYQSWHPPLFELELLVAVEGIDAFLLCSPEPLLPYMHLSATGLVLPAGKYGINMCPARVGAAPQ